jgi:hypothetical protein
MRTSYFRPTVVAVTVAVSTALGAARDFSNRAGLVVHEWGTFTSIAGVNGAAVDWQPQSGPTELPCFVQRDRLNVKQSFRARVRMETPVLYFYAPANVSVDVSVRFRRGFITEWFPPAAVGVHRPAGADFEGTIAWTGVSVSPGLSADFPRERAASHYYTARRTDASPLQSGQDRERFLFYRGVGHFDPPISATIGSDGTTVVMSSRDQIVGDVILFENRGGAMAYAVRHGDGRGLTFEAPSIVSESSAPGAELVRMLTANGLYEKEARAMVETWSDSWFEEGTRLFYAVSPSFIDAVLPLKIDPAPADVARVFVGRLELMSPFVHTTIRHALASGDRATLEKYGRFLQPMAERVLAETPPVERTLMEQHLRAVSVPATDVCR